MGDCVLTKVVVTANVGGSDVPQTMWQLGELRDGKPIWWAIFRTEQEAREWVKNPG